MILKEAASLFVTHVGNELDRNISGKITIELDCRKGGIGGMSMKVDRRLSLSDLPKEEKTDKT